jgi:DNA-binding transcriptional LysR family regulator
MSCTDLRLLSYFVAIADTGHFGRAAARLHISQSPLSRQIQKLEQDLGVDLFVRGRRGAQLTDAGNALLARARDLLERAAAFELDARRIGRGEIGRIRIGFVQTAVWTGLLPRALRLLRAESPGLEIELRHLVTAAQIAAIRKGDLDLGLVHGPSRAALGENIAADRIRGDRYVLAISRTNPLARRRALSPTDLRDVPLIAQVDARERLRKACAAHGWTPVLGTDVADWPSVLALVDADVGVGLVPSSFAATASKRVCLRPLKWLDIRTALWLVKRPAGLSTAAAELGRLLLSVDPDAR